MELRHFVQILGRRRWIVIVVVTVTLLVVGVGTYLSRPVYSSSVTVRVAQVQDSTISYYDLSYSKRLINTYVELVRSRPFLSETDRRLGLGIGSEALFKMIKAEAKPNTELFSITVENENPGTAMDIANTLGELLVEQGEKLYSGQGKSAQEILLGQVATVESGLTADRTRLLTLLADLDSVDRSAEIDALTAKIDIEKQTYATILESYERARLADEARANTATIVEPAVASRMPSQPKPALYLTLALIVGLAGGIGLAFLLENFDLAIYSADDLETVAQVPLLGSVPILRVPRKLRGAPLLLRRNSQSSAGEAFRVLRTNILALGADGPPRTVLITSIEAGAGKTTVLANLAVALAQSGRRIVAVDGDSRDPCLNSVFGVSDDFGLSNAIFEKGRFGSALRETRVPGLRVLTSGPQI